MTDINLDDIISEKTLSPEELEAYRDLFESDDFQDFNIDMYRQLHFYAFREIIGQLFYQGVPVEVVIYAFLNLWFRSAQKVFPSITEETIENWLEYDEVLLDFLFDTIREALSKAVTQNPSLKETPYDESLETIYEDWAKNLCYITEVTQPEGFEEMVQNVIDLLEDANQQLSSQSFGYLDDLDLYSIKTEILTQVYVLAYQDDHRIYYHLSKMWDLEILPYLGENLLGIVVLVQNNPSVFMPENREELMDAIEEVQKSPFYQAMLARVENAEKGEKPLITSLDIDIMA